MRGVWDGEAEARLIADEIETARKQGIKYKDMAVLVRASFQMRAFEERFVMLAVPYQVIGGPASSSAPRSATPTPICA